VEREVENDEKTKLATIDSTCHFFHPFERPQQVHFLMWQISSKEKAPAWQLRVRENFIFKHEGKLLEMTAENTAMFSMFSNAPPAVPRGQEMISGWTGKIYLRGETVCAMIQNDMAT
jgi:hypothetical protein